jgi:hypothetical protein
MGDMSKNHQDLQDWEVENKDFITEGPLLIKE